MNKTGNYDKRRVYFDKKDYLMLNVEGLMLNEGDSITMTAFSPVEVQIVSKTKDKVLVNLLQNNYYGWKAMIDGQPAKILTANMSFISVMVPAGEHEVVFSYDPVGVRIGFWISLTAIMGGISLLFFKGITAKGQRVFTRRTKYHVVVESSTILHALQATANQSKIVNSKL